MMQLYIIWNIFAIAVGAMEARVHHWRGSDIGSDKWIHTYYWIVRAVVCLGLASVLWVNPIDSSFTDFQVFVLFVVICAFSFSFFHNGTQYTARRIMNKRLDYHWFSKSKNTNARINFGGWTRTLMFLISLIAVLLI